MENGWFSFIVGPDDQTLVFYVSPETIHQRHTYSSKIIMRNHTFWNGFPKSPGRYGDFGQKQVYMACISNYIWQ